MTRPPPIYTRTVTLLPYTTLFRSSLLTGDNVRDDTTHWIEREMINTQLTGEHAFGVYRDVQVDWRAGHSRASRGAPYEKGFRYREDAYGFRSEEHTSERPSLMRISYAVFCLTKKNKTCESQR